MEQTVKCLSCGSSSPAGQQFCGTCGAKLGGEVQPQAITCPNCGSQSPAGQQFCGTCGARLAGVAQQMPQQVPQQVPTKVISPVVNRQPAEVKPSWSGEVRPTWGLAWGLFWRMLLLSLLFGGIIYLIAMVVMLALGFTFPTGL
jgi:uncharacterized protein CbrC (UPF0167 family)